MTSVIESWLQLGIEGSPLGVAFFSPRMDHRQKRVTVGDKQFFGLFGADIGIKTPGYKSFFASILLS